MENDITRLLMAKRDDRINVRAPKELRKGLEAKAKKVGLEFTDYVIARLAEILKGDSK